MRRPTQFVTALVSFLTALVLPLATNLASGSVPGPVQPYLWLAWPAAAVSATAAAVLEARRRRAPADGGGTDGPGEELLLRRAADQLARTLHGQWTAEAELRMLHRPRPLHVRWASTRRPVAGDPAGVLDRDTVGGRPLRLRLRGGIGGTGGIEGTSGISGSDSVAAVFARLPRRRLVVIGKPGAGKTVMAILLTLDLLEERQAQGGGPVPVLLTLSSWDPRTEHLHTWAARRLLEEYPALANAAVFGPDAARRLVTEGLVLPVLDGLDEMPVPLHAKAIEALDGISPGAPFVLTCRSEEYEAAVVAGGTVLATAAVVELEPVGVREVIAFLTARGVAGGDRWSAVAARLRTDSGGAPAKVLSSPLMSALARVVYTDPARDPAELLDPVRFADPASIEDHLLDAFIPAVYAHRPPPPTAGDAPGGAPLLFPAEAARAWLVFLAGHLQRRRTRELAWWRLHQALPRAVRLTGALALQLLTGLIVAVGMAVAAPLGVALAAGLSGGFGAGLVVVPPDRPGFVNIRVRGRKRLFVRRLVQGLCLGLVLMLGCGAGISAAAVLGVGVEGGPWEVTKAVFVGGLGVGTAFGAMLWLNVPADTIRSRNPMSVLRDDRTVIGVRVLVESLGSGLLAGLLMSQPYSGLRIGIAPALAFGFGAGLALALAGRRSVHAQTGLAANAWGWFLLARTWFALRGKLPWRLMAFLDDAHRRGVLRQVGAVYQFRHARLQDRLAPPPRE
ncbi:NACHT domain-containing protein [Streptomyces abikoensis]